ncbi:MAG: Low conductance mechanosensitive channel YnaI [Chloroflexi bacterium]|nr:Low conductance mechanosensitive channel YnaI [Chloroflexota bacterium]
MMDLLETTFYGNSLEDWLIALAALILTVLVFQILKHFLKKRIDSFINKTKTTIDDYLLPVLHQTRFFFLVAIGIYIGSLFLALPESTQDWVDKLIRGVFFLQVGFWGTGLIVYFVNRQISQKIDQEAAEDATTIDALGLVFKIALWSIITLLILDNVGVKVNSLVTSLGIGGIAVALAVQNVLGDLFASLSIALDKPFVINDFIAVDEYAGTVEDIGLKSTRIRSLSGEEIVFSNADLLSSRIRNYRLLQERRVSFSVGVSYGTPAEKLTRIPAIMEEIINGLEQIRFSRAHLNEMGDFSLNYEVVYFVQDPSYDVYMDIRQEINLALYERFGEEGIEFAYPTQTVFLEK